MKTALAPPLCVMNKRYRPSWLTFEMITHSPSRFVGLFTCGLLSTKAAQMKEAMTGNEETLEFVICVPRFGDFKAFQQCLGRQREHRSVLHASAPSLLGCSGTSRKTK